MGRPLYAPSGPSVRLGFHLSSSRPTSSSSTLNASVHQTPISNIPIHPTSRITIKRSTTSSIQHHASLTAIRSRDTHHQQECVAPTSPRPLTSSFFFAFTSRSQHHTSSPASALRPSSPSDSPPSPNPHHPHHRLQLSSSLRTRPAPCSPKRSPSAPSSRPASSRCCPRRRRTASATPARSGRRKCWTTR